VSERNKQSCRERKRRGRMKKLKVGRNAQINRKKKKYSVNRSKERRR
jgi:hypothetical protein